MDAVKQYFPMSRLEKIIMLTTIALLSWIYLELKTYNNTYVVA